MSIPPIRLSIIENFITFEPRKNILDSDFTGVKINQNEEKDLEECWEMVPRETIERDDSFLDDDKNVLEKPR